MQKKSIFGRSMLEMLGVLAIIGVLSIAAVLGIRYSMNKAKANKIAHDASLAYTKVVTSNGEYADWEDVAFNTESGLAFFAIRYADVDGSYAYVKSEEIPQAVCDHLLRMESESFNLCEEDMTDEVNCNVVNQNGLKTIVFVFNSTCDGFNPNVPRACEDDLDCNANNCEVCGEDGFCARGCVCDGHGNCIVNVCDEDTCSCTDQDLCSHHGTCSAECVENVCKKQCECDEPYHAKGQDCVECLENEDCGDGKACDETSYKKKMHIIVDLLHHTFNLVLCRLVFMHRKLQKMLHTDVILKRFPDECAHGVGF